ncbi:MAG: pitrilysin family protein [Sulfuricurvum sp.]|uniref:M16 family metallopeptidase n=1 Tax=Sulfuricurvum sp. TaxID=2025608 RepID=UPI00262D090E|nr:pitrilysin family protein [Sulfuricurvum sp.]MDD2828272.1 pitrilysin family protein [Sulfuricurvum sp.]MDD4949773.1 pitrilysin family protein [Sulfuricurvum sp.]
MASTLEHIDIKGVKIPFIFEQDKRLPIVSMQVIFTGSGSIDEGKNIGLARLSAKMMNEGTLKRGSVGFADALDARAIQLSTNAGNETLVMELGTLRDEFDTGLSLMDELLRSPNLTKESLNKVKTRTMSDIARKEADFDTVASDELKAILFEATPMATPNIGTKESIEKIKLSDVESFLKSKMVLSNALIIMGGDITIEDAKKKATTLISSLEVGKLSAPRHYEVRKSPKESILKRPQTEQTYLYFGAPFAMNEGDSEFYKARVAMFILGSSGFGSRLMEEIRVKRGLAYSAYSRLSVAKTNTYFSGYLQTKLESGDEAKKSVIEVIDTFVKSGVTQSELDQARKFLLGSEPLRVETLSQRLGRTFSEYYQGKELGSSLQELEMIRGLSLEELNDFIKRHNEITQLSYAIVTK